MPPKKSENARSADSHIAAIPRPWLAVLAVLLIAPWIVVTALWFRLPAPPPPAAEADPSNHAPMEHANGGRWGRLTLVPIVISPPVELVSTDWGDVRQPIWYFPGTNADLVAQALQAAGVPAADAARLRNEARSEPRIAGVVLSPDPAWVRALSPDVRAGIYTRLARSGLNVEQAQAFRFHGATPDDWLGTDRLTPRTRDLVKSLIYRDGEYMLFADADLIRSEVAGEEELRYLAKKLLRQPTVLVRLSVESPADVEGLAEYWGRGGRRTDIKPLLESVAGAGPDRFIDIVHLLPSFARNYLYRYPRLSAADFDKPVIANCLWTSLNFFRDHPDNRYLDVDTALRTLKEDYFVVESGFELGDIVAFLDEEGDIFHAAVYIADDLVFSKNGTSPMAPWTFMSIDDLKGYYGSRSPNPRLIVHRRSDF
jgi:hypothetical protein